MAPAELCHDATMGHTVGDRMKLLHPARSHL
jgi:hypothetical protein